MRALVLLMLVLGVAGCTGEGASSSGRTVVAAFYPLAWATERAAPADTRVVNLTPAGAEPHDLELAPSDVEAVDDADLVVYVGGGFQPALESAVEGRNGSSLDLLDEGEELHIWLDPVRFRRAVLDIASALEGSDATDPIAAIETLDSEYRGGLADCDRRTLVTTHSAFGQLARRYGLTEMSLAGRTPEAEPSPRELEELVERVRASGATTVFAEPLVSDDVAQTVAREADVTVATLDPIEGLSTKRLEAGQDYLSVMRSNLVALRKALGCR